MNDSLSFESLFEGAKRAASKAMNDHAHGEYDEFALHAGVAIERLAKAALVKMNPLYVAGGKLHIPSPDKVKIYTISALEALARLQSFGVGKVDNDLKLLIELRNGTVHTAGGDEAKTHIPTLAKAITAILEHLGISEHDFWDRWTSAINMAVNEQRTEIERLVEIRIRQARHVFEDRFKGLPPGAKERAMATPNPALSDWIEAVEIRAGGVPIFKTSGGDCPACGGRGILTFEPTEQTATNTHYSADGFACSMCTFAVVGPEEMAALRKASAPSMVATMSVSHGPTLAPENIKMIKTQTG
ncbi:hypothetical protein AB0L66_11425 [Streptomyces sp. NPDC052207]|uniref:hypothetical protein n=1 Tax=Streptomyces sp. NPDC052207 TaxID=3155418 RepID=UPI00343BDC29